MQDITCLRFKLIVLNHLQVPAKGGLQKSAIDELTTFDVSFSGVAGSSFSSSVPPLMVCKFFKSLTCLFVFITHACGHLLGGCKWS